MKSKLSISLWVSELIKHFSYQKKTKVEREHYFFANDTDFFSSLRKVPAVSPIEETPCMLIVGNSYLLSSLALLREKSGAQIVLLCDIDPAIIEYTLFCKEILDESQSLAEFYKKLFSLRNPAIPNEEMIAEFKDSFEHEAIRLGNDHISASQENFDASKKAHKNTIIVPLCVNLFDSTEVSKLAKLVPGKITLFNLTNVRQWDHEDQLGESLLKLPQIDAPIILNASHRETFGYGLNLLPKTQALTAPISTFNETYIEAILFLIFIRPGHKNETVCQEIVKVKNHVNTKDNLGYTPLEIAIFHFCNPLWVKLLLKYGAKITPNLLGNLEQSIQEYYQKVYKMNFAFSDKNLAEIKTLLQSIPVILPVSKDTIYIPEINAGMRVSAQSNLKIGKAGNDVLLTVINGDIEIDVLGNFASVQTLTQGNIKVKQFMPAGEYHYISLISAEHVVLEGNYQGKMHIIAAQTITAKRIGGFSWLLAKNGMNIESVDEYSSLLCEQGTISLEHANEAQLFVNKTAIEIKSLKYRMNEQEAKVVIVSGLKKDSPEKPSYQSIGEKLLDSDEYGAIIAKFIFSWICFSFLREQPLAKDLHSSLSKEEMHFFILDVLGYPRNAFGTLFNKENVNFQVAGFCCNEISPETVSWYKDFLQKSFKQKADLKDSLSQAFWSMNDNSNGDNNNNANVFN